MVFKLSNKIKTFRFSSFSGHWDLQKICQFLNSTSLIYETKLTNIGTAKSARTTLRTPPFYFTFQSISEAATQRCSYKKVF